MSFLSRVLHLNTEAVVTIAATLTFAGFVYYSFVYREDGERSVEYVAGDPYWSRRDDLFVRGEDKLRDSLRRQGESGGPLLVVLEDESASSKRLRDHIWSDGIVQNLLRGRGGETSRRALRFPPIAVRVHVNEDDGAFMNRLVTSGGHGETRSPMFILISMGELRIVNVRSLLRDGNLERARVQIRRLLSRFLSPPQNVAANSISPTLLAKQRKRAEDLILMRGDWDVSRLVRNGIIDARDVVPDNRGGDATAPRSTNSSSKTASRSNNSTTHASLKDRQDQEFAASLARDREKQRKREEEEMAKVMEMSIEAERKRQLKIRKDQIPDEPTTSDSNAVSFVFKLPGGNRISRRFRESETFENLFCYLDCEMESKGVTSYSVNLAYPRRTFLRHDTGFDPKTTTLSSQGLIGRIALLVVDLDK